MADLWLTGGGAVTQLLGNDGNNDIQGSTADETLSGAEHDVLAGISGHDVVFGGDGNDLLLTDLGLASLTGGAGNDLLIGGNGDDYIVVDTANAVVVELTAEGTDTIASGDIDLYRQDYQHCVALALLGSANLNLTGGTEGDARRHGQPVWQ